MDKARVVVRKVAGRVYLDSISGHKQIASYSEGDEIITSLFDHYDNDVLINCRVEYDEFKILRVRHVISVEEFRTEIYLIVLHDHLGNDKIESIKRFRRHFPLQLKQAKDLVEKAISDRKNIVIDTVEQNEISDLDLALRSDSMVTSLQTARPIGAIWFSDFLALSENTEESETEPSEHIPLPENSRWREGYYYSDDLLTFYQWSKMREGKKTNALLIGDAGNGKTDFAKRFAGLLGYEFERINAAQKTYPESIFGKTVIEENSTKFVKNSATLAMERGRAVILIDEINRLHDPMIQNVFFSLLEERYTEIDAETIYVGSDVIFLLTANIGDEFTSTIEMDKGLYNRFHAVIKCDILPSDQEYKLIRSMLDQEKTEQLSFFLSAIREIEDFTFSTRQVLHMCDMLSDGIAWEIAIKWRILNSLTEDDLVLKKTIIDIFNAQGLGWIE